MITRPLELSARLRPPPKSFEFLFFVNGGFIVLFFLLFGSQFVLSPGLRLNGANLTLPTSSAALANATHTSLVLSVDANGLFFVENGIIRSRAKLREWLADQARKHPGAVLLVKADENIPSRVLLDISQLAREVGLGEVQCALQPPALSAAEPSAP